MKHFRSYCCWLFVFANLFIFAACSGGSESAPESPPIPTPTPGTNEQEITCGVGFNNDMATTYADGFYHHLIDLGFDVSKGNYAAGVVEFGVALYTSDGTIMNKNTPKSNPGDVYITTENINGLTMKYFSGILLDDNAHSWGEYVSVVSKNRNVKLDYCIRYYTNKTNKFVVGDTETYTYEPKTILGEGDDDPISDDEKDDEIGGGSDDGAGGKTSGENKSISYTIEGKTFKTILVEGNGMNPFYIMQTEIIPNKEISFGDYKMDPPDKNKNGTLIQTEFRTFLMNLREKTGLPWRLPTKDEWMFAASGGKYGHGYTYSGGNSIDDVAWYNGNRKNGAYGVAGKKANELNLYDMSGNYAELVFNDDTSYDSEADVNVDGNYYGGSWEDPADECTVKSYKEGTTKGNIAGTNASEKLAVKCEAVTVRLVYNKYNE